MSLPLISSGNTAVSEGVRSGHVAIVGRPNTGKSTLINALLGKKLSIVSPRSQTTRWSLLGIKTTPRYQIAFLDTPGFQASPLMAINKYMNRSVQHAILSVDLLLLVVEASRWKELDDVLCANLQRQHCRRVVLAVNKIDVLPRRELLLQQLQEYQKKYSFLEIVPISALKKINLEVLEQVLSQCLYHSGQLYPADQLTDKGESFFIAELIREQLMLRLGEELPYRMTITIEENTEHKDIRRIRAVIWVDNKRHKAMVIGKGGCMLKEVGTGSRKGIEDLLGNQIYLGLWVKIRKGWFDSVQQLHDFGYSATE